ncbi:hypothetical protein EWM64_g886 [Hericium alpestre]|uniref:Uncharacterized protein n=1 Tax=Hericium alpestre TaxID=135208 RepID=A0A4Z0A7U3_9AGAM|nr:hypothetical protein EWM64_g886 [Hericium alpestre]
MPDLRHVALALTFLTVLHGTIHSITNHSYLDTSNPLLTALPHPLHETHYFASKLNPLNTVFLKRAWGWTSAAFLAHIITSPPETHRFRRTVQYIIATAAWLVFTSWFFGPALLERVIAASGGVCVLHLPSGAYLPVPEQLCFDRTHISSASHPQLFPVPLLLVPEIWKGGVPRLRRGHDVSGHVFLVTLSILFLTDQLRASFASKKPWSPAHRIAVFANGALLVLWLFAIWITSVYFHSPMEKISGFCE